MDEKRKRLATDDCAFCNKTRKLCLSHAIPDAFFRDMFKQGDGQSLRSTDGRPAGKSQESGKCLLLCAECETLFNMRFDRAGTKFLRQYRQILNGSGPRHVAINHWDLIEFVLSIFWRAAVSTSDKYRGFVLSESKLRLLKSVLIRRKASALGRIAVRFRNIVDEKGYIEPSMMPADAGTLWAVEPDDKKVWLALLINGFYLELEMPGPRDRLQSQGYLSHHDTSLEILDVGVRSDPHLKEAFQAMYQKHRDGDVVKGYYQDSMRYHRPLSSDPVRQEAIDAFGKKLAEAERSGGDPRKIFTKVSC